jgi:hypothetical protein
VSEFQILELAGFAPPLTRADAFFELVCGGWVRAALAFETAADVAGGVEGGLEGCGWPADSSLAGCPEGDPVAKGVAADAAWEAFAVVVLAGAVFEVLLAGLEGCVVGDAGCEMGCEIPAEFPPPARALAQRGP